VRKIGAGFQRYQLEGVDVLREAEACGYFSPNNKEDREIAGQGSYDFGAAGEVSHPEQMLAVEHYSLHRFDSFKRFLAATSKRTSLRTLCSPSFITGLAAAPGKAS
jgi:hypothetical protein